jgi:hypothetical protein
MRARSLKLEVGPNGHKVTETSLEVYLVHDLCGHNVSSMLLDCAWDPGSKMKRRLNLSFWYGLRSRLLPPGPNIVHL